jgi:hypothetical protein
VQEAHAHASVSQPIEPIQSATQLPATPAASTAMSGGMKAAIIFAVLGLLAFGGAIVWILLRK